MTRILIVDDSPIDLTLITGLLKKNEEYEIESAVNGEDALEKVGRSAPDLVVTDMLMPVLDGLGLVKLMSEEHPLVPVVLTTGKGSEELAVEALEQGAASYISKRNLNVDLLETVERVLSASQHRRLEARLMEGLVLQACTFDIRSDHNLFRPLIHYLQAQLAQVNFGAERDRTRIGVAIEEAMNNALQHGNLELDSELRERDFTGYIEQIDARMKQTPYRDRSIRLESRITPEEAHFLIRDEGKGFDPANLPDPKAPESLEKASGRGILLMRTFMDEVLFSQPGNQVEMKKLAHANP